MFFFLCLCQQTGFYLVGLKQKSPGNTVWILKKRHTQLFILHISNPHPSVPARSALHSHAPTRAISLAYCVLERGVGPKSHLFDEGKNEHNEGKVPSLCLLTDFIWIIWSKTHTADRSGALEQETRGGGYEQGLPPARTVTSSHPKSAVDCWSVVDNQLLDSPGFQFESSLMSCVTSGWSLRNSHAHNHMHALFPPCPLSVYSQEALHSPHSSPIILGTKKSFVLLIRLRLTLDLFFVGVLFSFF